MAEEPFNRDRALILDDQKMHHLIYNSAEDHQVSRYREKGNIHIIERDVARLDGIAIEQTKIDRLHLLLGVRTHDDGKLHEDELRRLVIRFR